MFSSRCCFFCDVERFNVASVMSLLQLFQRAVFFYGELQRCSCSMPLLWLFQRSFGSEWLLFNASFFGPCGAFSFLECFNTAPVQCQFFCCFRWAFQVHSVSTSLFMSLLFQRGFFESSECFIVAPVEYCFFGCFKAILFFLV